MIENNLMGGATLATATAAKTGTTVTANINGTVTTVQVARDLTVASGDVVIVIKIGAQWVALGRYFGAAPTPPDNPTPPDPQPGTVTGTLVVAPIETRTYRNGSWITWDDTVYQGNFGGNGNNTGCVFYGAGPRSLAGATVTSATAQVRRISGGIFAAQTATMRLMTDATRPGGAPTLTSSATGPTLPVDGTDNAFAVPTSWAQSMVDATAGGLAFFESDGDPYIKFAGKSQWSPTFTITINWQRG